MVFSGQTGQDYDEKRHRERVLHHLKRKDEESLV